MPSKIEWTNETWNPIVGCSKVSSGCDNCYAERMARRLAHMGKEGYGYVTHKKGGWNGKIYRKFYNDVINKPLHWKKPRMVFVSSMGDLFHENVPFEWIDKVVEVAEVTPWHTYQFLTKRVDRMLEYFKWRWNNADQHTLDCTKAKQWKKEHDIDDVSMYISNLWLGVTCENQEQVDKRIPKLLEIPAAKRFVSLEPCLEKVEIERWLHHDGCPYLFDDESDYEYLSDAGECCCDLEDDYRYPRVNWVIVGGETGPKARPMKMECAEKIVADCKEADVPCFVKKLPIDGKVTGDMTLWPESLRVRQYPKGGE